MRLLPPPLHAGRGERSSIARRYVTRGVGPRLASRSGGDTASHHHGLGRTSVLPEYPGDAYYRNDP